MCQLCAHVIVKMYVSLPTAFFLLQHAGETALHVATKLGNDSVVIVLLANGADVNKVGVSVVLIYIPSSAHRAR